MKTDKLNYWLEYAQVQKEKELSKTKGENRINQIASELLELLELRFAQGQFTSEELKEEKSKLELLTLLNSLNEVILVGSIVITLEKAHGGWLLLENGEGIRFYNNDNYVRQLLQTNMDKLKYNLDTGVAMIVKTAS